MDSKTAFEQRQTHFKTLIAEVDKQLDKIAWLRLLVFVVAIVVQIWSWSWGDAWWLLCLAASIFGFALVVKWNIGVSRKHRFLSLMLKINEEEVDRLEGRLGELNEGEEFVNDLHPYSSDLDIFGKHSLFQLLNRATTGFGKQTLANWLLGQSAPAEISERHKAVAFLSDKTDWQQSFEAKGRMRDQGKFDRQGLINWLNEESKFSKNIFNQVWPYIFPVLLAVASAFAYSNDLIIFAVLGLILVQFAMLRRIEKFVKQVLHDSEKRRDLLSSWGELIEHIESLSSDDPRIEALKARLSTEGKTASAEIKHLAKIVGKLEFRNSGIPHFVMNMLFFWDVIWVIALEKWKGRLASKLLDWFEVIGEMEALASLSATQFAFPGWQNPEVKEGNFELDGENIGHPLIPLHQRINNPISLNGNGTVWLITGSNMSGKSTYLRTIGLNVVLALAGAPVCASKLQLSPMQIVSSMRTIDSLEENTSSFYAELKRLKMVIEEVKEKPNVLFLLDEILKGTNSKDRQAGARALVMQLHKYGGSGMVSTHDIELVDMADELPLAVKNYSFNCEVSPDGKLDFDYTLTPGQCLSMNATALMRAMGIEM